jgi:hypothetical protein
MACLAQADGEAQNTDLFKFDHLTEHAVQSLAANGRLSFKIKPASLGQLDR